MLYMHNFESTVVINFTTSVSNCCEIKKTSSMMHTEILVLTISQSGFTMELKKTT